MARPEPMLIQKETLVGWHWPPLHVEILDVTRPYPFHKHNFDELVVILSGQAEHQIEDERYVAAAGDVYLFAGDRSHCFFDQQEFRVANVQFTAEAFGADRGELQKEPGFRALFELEPEARSAHRFESRLRLLPKELRYVTTVLEELQRELGERREGFEFLARTGFLHLCGYLGRCYSRMSSDKPRSLSRIGAVLNFMEANAGGRLSLRQLASRAHMSESTFLRNFKAAMRCSPIDHLVRLRVNRACELLLDSDLSVTEIAFEVGFNSVEYFCRRFRAQVGVSASDYRKRAAAAATAGR